MEKGSQCPSHHKGGGRGGLCRVGEHGWGNREKPDMLKASASANTAKAQRAWHGTLQKAFGTMTLTQGDLAEALELSPSQPSPTQRLLA